MGLERGALLRERPGLLRARRATSYSFQASFLFASVGFSGLYLHVWSEGRILTRNSGGWDAQAHVRAWSWSIPGSNLSLSATHCVTQASPVASPGLYPEHSKEE